MHTEEKAKFEPLLEEDTDECPAEALSFEQDGMKWLEFHANFLGGDSNDKHDELRMAMGTKGGSYSVRFKNTASAHCEYSHATAVYKCRNLLYHMGEDESIYKAYAREGNEWVIRRVHGLREKTEGPGEMISAVQDEWRGYGLYLSKPALAGVNELCRERGWPALEDTPGLRFLVRGKNRDGWWRYDQFEEEVVDVMDCIDVIAPTKQLVLEVDHYAGHAKF